MDRASDRSGIFALAASLWHRECAHHGVDPNDPRIAEALRLVSPADDLAIAGVPAGWRAIAWLSERHVAAMPADIRRSQGSFYTPPSLATLLAGHVARSEGLPKGLIVDPACGAGALLAAVAESICRVAAPSRSVGLIASTLRGTDLDPVAVALCEFAVRMAVLPAWSSIADPLRPHLPPFAELRDGLSDSRPAAIVIANPPFGRARLSATQRERHAGVLYGHAHWPTLFVHAGINRLVPDGQAAFVLPASLLGGAYYKRLRRFLKELASPSWLAFVPERTGVFAGDVLQEAVLGVFCTTKPEEVTVARVEAENRRTTAVRVARCRVAADGGPWLLPRSADDVDLLETAKSWPRRLTDYGWRVSTGPLVWNRHKDQLHENDGPSRIPVVWAGDLQAGRVVSRPRAGRFVELRQGQEWLVLREPALLVQRTTAPEQHRRLVVGILDRAALDRLGGRVVVENHLNVCTWDGTGKLTPQLLYAYLSSHDADRLYRCITGSVAVSAYELNALPVPTLEGMPPGPSAVRDERRAA